MGTLLIYFFNRLVHKVQLSKRDDWNEAGGKMSLKKSSYSLSSLFKLVGYKQWEDLEVCSMTGILERMMFKMAERSEEHVCKT